MSYVDWVKVGYFFAPQDRRKIGEVPIQEFVVKCYKERFKQDVFDVEDQGNKGVCFSILNATKAEAEEVAESIEEILDLSDHSFYTIVDIVDSVSSKEGEDGDDPGEDDMPAKERNEDLSNTLEKVDKLVGVEDFKSLCHLIADVSESEDAGLLRKYFKRATVVFSISGGDGFSTYIRYLNEVLIYSDIMQLDEWREIKEIKKAEDNEDMISDLKDIRGAGELIAFDLTFKLDSIDSEEFAKFLREIKANRDNNLPVFKIPHLTGEQKDKLIRLIEGVMPVILIDVPPFSISDYSEYARRVLDEMYYDLDEKAFDEIEELIVRKQSKEYFYGFHSVKALAEDIVHEKMLGKIRRNERMSFTITEKDLTEIINKNNEELGGFDKLDELVGINEIRERIDEIVAQLELSCKLPVEERPSMHMLFTGNPGTGKTTVARILGKILKEKKVLSKGRFFERNGRELVGKYIGETAPTTNAICRDAYGSILFIDEAYTLFHKDDERDFGKEALEALLTQMENHRQDFIVILSGYSDRMKEMLDANPGLASRIPHEIKFRNFTREELAGIFMSMAGKIYKCSDDLEKVSKDYFMGLSDEALSGEAFSNARFVRNLYERTVSKAALRIQALEGGSLSDIDTITLTGEDFVKASGSEEFKELLGKKRGVIGF